MSIFLHPENVVDAIPTAEVPAGLVCRWYDTNVFHEYAYDCAPAKDIIAAWDNSPMWLQDTLLWLWHTGSTFEGNLAIYAVLILMYATVWILLNRLSRVNLWWNQNYLYVFRIGQACIIWIVLSSFKMLWIVPPMDETWFIGYSSEIRWMMKARREISDQHWEKWMIERGYIKQP